MVDQVIKQIAADKERAELKENNSKLNVQVDLLNLKVTSLTIDLKHERDVLKEVKKEKDEVENNYQNAARTIAEQQTQITIREEKI